MCRKINVHKYVKNVDLYKYQMCYFIILQVFCHIKMQVLILKEYIH